MQKAYFPMFVDISEKKILVVGGGYIASRRVESLLIFASHITVVAPKACESIRTLEGLGKIVWKRRQWEEQDLVGQDIVLMVTDNRKLNAQVGALCKEKGILVNVADDKEKCDFYFPGIVEKENVIVGISTGGKNPNLAKKIREWLENLEI